MVWEIGEAAPSPLWKLGIGTHIGNIPLARTITTRKAYFWGLLLMVPMALWGMTDGGRATLDGAFAVVFLGERLTSTSVNGGLVIIAGVMLANYSFWKNRWPITSICS